MELKTCILTKNDCYKRGVTMAPKGVMVHSTGANNPNLRRYLAPDDGTIGKNEYGNDWNRSGLDVCVHAFIGRDKNGKAAVYQTLPWNTRGWHCGGQGNDTHISFEICEDGLTNRAYFQETYQAAVELTAYLCKQYNLDPGTPGVVTSHAEGAKRGVASNHGDPDHWWSRFGVTMDQFRADVKKAMGAAQEPEVKGLYRVRRNWKDAKSQLGAFAVLDNAKAVCKPGYGVYDENGHAVAYAVQAGNTLGAIAGRFETTVAAIAAKNNIANPNLIHAGQLLILPGAAQKPALKPLDTVAREVIRGDWGNGPERTRRLKAAGYDPAAVQSVVNRLL